MKVIKTKMNKEPDNSKRESIDELDLDLGSLVVKAPEDAIPRLKRRVRNAQMGKDLIEKQAHAFWTVIDAFLRVIFGSSKEIEKDSNEKKTGE